MSIDDVTTKGLPAFIHVEGQILAKKYDFMMMGDLNTNPYKIAKVTSSSGLFEIVTYLIEIGPNVDAAFISICAYALEKMFRRKKRR